MNSIEHYLEKWNLSEPVRIAKTRTSDVFRVKFWRENAVLKKLTPVGVDFETKGRLALECFDGKGAAKVYESDTEAILMEYLEGPKLAEMLEQGKDDYANQLICDVLEELHSYGGKTPVGIESLEERFESLFKRSLASSDPLFKNTASIARELLDSQEHCVLLHGDIHHTNIIESHERGWLAIDPQPSYGERTYDFANSFYNPDNMPEVVETPERLLSMADIFSSRLKISRERVLKFAYAHGGLSISWQIDDGDDPKRRMQL